MQFWRNRGADFLRDAKVVLVAICPTTTLLLVLLVVLAAKKRGASVPDLNSFR